MKAKAYLSQAIWLDQLIDNKIEQQERLRAIAEKATTNISAERVSSTPKTGSRENVMVKLIDLSHEINDDIDGLIDLREEIRNTISQVGDDRCQVLLEMKYLNNKDWDDIAMVLNRDIRTVFRIHGQALAKIEKSLENVTQCH